MSCHRNTEVVSIFIAVGGGLIHKGKASNKQIQVITARAEGFLNYLKKCHCLEPASSLESASPPSEKQVLAQE